MTRKVAFIGLGVMGFPMAGHLHAAGLSVAVYNRTAARAGQWGDIHGGHIAKDPADAARGAELVFVCVGDDDDVRMVVDGDSGALAAMSAGSVLVDHTTTSAVLARELEQRAAAAGVGFVDAPVSGGQAGAEAGQLTAMCGGSAKSFGVAQPVIEAYARRCAHLGPAGSGQLAKMVNQICIAGVLQGLSEGIHFAERAGLDPKAVIDVVSQGAAQSWQMDHRAGTMIQGQFDFGFAVEWMRKDLRYTLQQAGRHGVELPLTSLVARFYEEVRALGGDRWDTSSLIERLRRAD